MNFGKTTWVIAGGQIPLFSTGREPEFTSRDILCVLNTNPKEANIQLTIYHSDKPPTGPYRIKVKDRITCHIYFNDLIDPEPLLLDKEYAVIIKSDIPVVVQFTRMNTSQANLASTMTMAFPAEN
jgi:hypothetical protein